MNISLSSLLNEKNHTRWLIFFAVIFVFIYSYWAFTSPLVFNSPDETSNYLFTKIFAESSKFSLPENLNVEFQNIIHPRSVNVNNEGSLTPTSFVGIILIYGMLAKIFSTSIILYLTPIFAVVGVSCFYGLIKRIFEPKIAFISSLLLFILPPFWYNASRTMFHTILQISLLIIGLFLLTKIDWQKVNLKSIILFLASGLFVGFSLITRYSEIIWIGLIFLILGIVYFKQSKKFYYVLFLVLASLFFIAMLLLNKKFYGGYLMTGYVSLKTALKTALLANDSKTLGNIFSNFYYVFIQYYWWIFIPVIFGFVSFVKGGLTKIQKVYLIIILTSSIWLIYYYGKMNFTDNLSRTISMGSSYFRYWLPIFIFCLPWVSIFFVNIKYKILKQIFLGFFIFLSLYFTIWGTNESFASVRQDVISYSQIRQKASTMIEPDAILMGERIDKIFFPERKVIELVQGDKRKIYQNLSKVIEKYPVYYFSFMNLDDIHALSQKDFAPAGLELVDCKPLSEYYLCKIDKY